MPYDSMFGFGGLSGSLSLIPIIIMIIGLIFVAVLFVFLGIELKWQLKNILLLILLVISSGIMGLTVMGNIAFIEMVPKQVSLKDAIKSAGFKVYVPKYLPEGMKFREAVIEPGPPGFKATNLHYSGLGQDLTIIESKDTYMGGGPFGPTGPGSQKLEINGHPARLSTEEEDFSLLFFELDSISIEIETNLPKSEIIKVASSLK